MTEVSTQRRVWRGIRFSAKTVWMAFLAVSLIANIALGITNFILQPIWRAATVATATAAVQAKAEIAERQAVSKVKIKEQAKARTQRAAAVASVVAAATTKTKLAVAQARREEKAKGRVRRVAVAVPFVGFGIAGAFEYSDYSQWKSEHPDGDLQQYTKEVIEITSLVVDEVLDELPEEKRPNKESLIATYERVLDWVTAWGAESTPNHQTDNDQDVASNKSWADWFWGDDVESDPRTY